MDKATEIALKTERLTKMLAAENLEGLLLQTQHNFFWLTAGGLTSVVRLARVHCWCAATANVLYDVAVRAYAKEGFSGEERLHHKGGACGYRTREFIRS